MTKILIIIVNININRISLKIYTLHNSSKIMNLRKHKMLKFPLKLHAILLDPNNESLITWLPNGHSWRVIKRKMFEKEVIPLYFRHSNFSSFMRQVNGWGFQRVNDHENEFQHEVKSHSTQALNKFCFN